MGAHPGILKGVDEHSLHDRYSMFIAPIPYTLKCPNCGADILFSDLVDQTSFSIKGKLAQCKNCNKTVTWSKSSIRIFGRWIYALTSCILLYLVVASIWKNMDASYAAIPITVAMLCLLFAIRSAKLVVVT